jgi:hypothetical protein
MYDPAIARWNAVDALGELYYSLSTYHYAGNNPIKYIDVDGRSFWQSKWMNENNPHWRDQLSGDYTGSDSGSESNSNNDDFGGNSDSDQGENTKKKDSGVEASVSGGEEKGSKEQSVLIGWSVDGVISSPVGYMIEYGEIYDPNSGFTFRFSTHGMAFGLEASVGFNLIIIKPKENFKITDLEGTSWGFSFTYGISFSVSGNSTPAIGGGTKFDSYYMIKIGLGPGAGFNNTPGSYTRFIETDIPIFMKSVLPNIPIIDGTDYLKYFKFKD